MNAEDQQLLTEIEQGEAWLASVMGEYPSPSPRASEHLKLSVRIAVAESAVRMDPGPPPSAHTIRRVKANVRTELLRSSAAGERTTWWRRRRLVMGGLAAAAALAFWLLPYTMRPAPDADANAALALDEFSDVLASSATPDFDQQVESLDETLNELSELLALPDWLGVDEQIDDLEDDIDSLIEENRTWLNV